MSLLKMSSVAMSRKKAGIKAGTGKTSLQMKIKIFKHMTG